VNGASLREEVEATKARIAALRSDGKVPEEPDADDLRTGNIPVAGAGSGSGSPTTWRDTAVERPPAHRDSPRASDSPSPAREPPSSGNRNASPSIREAVPEGGQEERPVRNKEPHDMTDVSRKIRWGILEWPDLDFMLFLNRMRPWRIRLSNVHGGHRRDSVNGSRNRRYHVSRDLADRAGNAVVGDPEPRAMGRPWVIRLEG